MREDQSNIPFPRLRFVHLPGEIRDSPSTTLLVIKLRQHRRLLIMIHINLNTYFCVTIREKKTKSQARNFIFARYLIQQLFIRDICFKTV